MKAESTQKHGVQQRQKESNQPDKMKGKTIDPLEAPDLKTGKQQGPSRPPGFLTPQGQPPQQSPPPLSHLAQQAQQTQSPALLPPPTSTHVPFRDPAILGMCYYHSDMRLSLHKFLYIYTNRCWRGLYGTVR